jgi:hypothetical protein
MKKILFLIAGLAIGAGAYILNIKPGWQLLGTEHDINVTVFNNPNIEAVWAWDGRAKKWEAFLPNIDVNLSQYNILPLNKIDSYKGYWVKSTGSFNVNINESSYDIYPIGEYIGYLWGFEWYKTKAFYPGDERFIGNDVFIDYNASHLILKAYKKDNKDSRAQAVANLPDIKGIGAKVDLITDNVYSLFQAVAVSQKDINLSEPLFEEFNNTSGLTFAAGISIRKHSINCWWDIIYPKSGKYYGENIGIKNYDFDLTTLTHTNDIKVEISTDNEKIIYKVYNLANGNIIFNKSLDINSTKMTNFEGFNKVIFRSRIKDYVANENNEEAIEKSENIVTDFNILR